MNRTITTLDDLRTFLQSLPDGTAVDGLASDLEASNIDTRSFLTPDGEEINVTYTGPVQEGYVSPFERN
jgi:hypothetical protein